MGRKTLKIKGYSSEDIKALFKSDYKYTIGIRLYAIYQISLGKPSREVEKLYDTSFKQILNWVHRFEEEGIAGLKDKPKSGRKPKLTIEQKDEVKQVILSESPEKYGYNTATWNGPILIDYIKKTYGIEYKKAQIYNILKNMGLTFQRGRANYPEADEEKRKEFIKLIKKT